MTDISRRQWLASAALAGAAATTGGAAQAQTRASADDLVRAVKGARVFDLSFTWSEQAPGLGLNPPYAFALNRLEQTAKAQGVEVRPGDSLLIRTGWGQFFARDNARYLGEQSPGPGPDAARWMIDRKVAWPATTPPPSRSGRPPTARSCSACT